MKPYNFSSKNLLLFLAISAVLGVVACNLQRSNWSEVCVNPFARVMPKSQEASIEVVDNDYVIHFPIHVVGMFSGSGNGRYGRSEAVDGVYQEPGTEFPLNTLKIPVAAMVSGETLELGPGSGISLEGFLWWENYHLEYDWDFPKEWKGTFIEEMCNHSCDLNGEGDANCGIHWSKRYAFSHDQLQGTVHIGSFGTSPGDNVEIEVFGIVTGWDVNEDHLDCCAGLHITMKGAIDENGRIVLEEYCDNPKGCFDPYDLTTDHISLVFYSSGLFSSPEEQLQVCWDAAMGIYPW